MKPSDNVRPTNVPATMSSPPPTRSLNPLHLVAGDSAAGCLRAACTSCGLPGAVAGLSADLAHGPLDDAEASATYLRAIAKSYGETDTADGSPFAQWQALGERLTRERPDALIVWVADNVADATFLAMTCDRLAGRREPLWRVQVREVDQRGLRLGSALTALRSHVAMYSPEQLAQQFAARELLSNEDRLLLAQDFARVRDTSGHLRRLESGCVVGVPVEYYDPLLLSACGSDWQAAGRVVGMAMGGCDGANLVGDAFFTLRLLALIEAGYIETSGLQSRVLDCFVRLAAR